MSRPGGLWIVGAAVAGGIGTAFFPLVAVCLVFALLPLLPVLGNLLAGPWIAPAELLLLVVSAGLCWAPRRDEEGEAGEIGGMERVLGLSTLAAAAGAVAAIAAALRAHEVPGALADLFRNLFSVSPLHAAVPLRSALVHGTALLGFLLAWRLVRARGARALAGLFSGSAVAAGLFALVEGLFRLQLWPRSRYESSSDFRRVVSTLADYNAAGTFFALALFPSILLAFSEKRASRALGVAGTLFSAVGLVLSGSRSAWIGAVVSGGLLLVLLTIRLRRSRAPLGKPFLAVLLLVCTVGLGVGLSPGRTGEVLRSRATSLFSTSEVTHTLSTGRFYFWVAGVRMLKANPFSGVGPGRVPSRFAEYRPGWFKVKAENVHAYFLQVLDENGIPGGALLLAPFLALGLFLVRLQIRSRLQEVPPTGIAFGGGLLAATISGLPAHPWLLPEMQVLYWGAAAGFLATLPLSDRTIPRRIVVLSTLVLVLWAPICLVTAPGRDRGRFGYGAWGFEEGPGDTQWLGPSSLSFTGPEKGDRVRLRLLVAEAPPGMTAPVSVRVDGQAWVEAFLNAGETRSLDLSLPEEGPQGRHAIEVRTPWGFCPVEGTGEDRRVLSLRASRPEVLERRKAP
jgi:O-antigen ligase